MNDMMKAVQLHSFGGPEVLLYEDTPRPEVQTGEVLIQVNAASLNPWIHRITAALWITQ